MEFMALEFIFTRLVYHNVFNNCTKIFNVHFSLLRDSSEINTGEEDLFWGEVHLAIRQRGHISSFRQSWGGGQI